ncbi:MAG: type II secretion system protein J [Planctomycetaceae bacterium]
MKTLPQTPSRSTRTATFRTGFTLVEMLVAVALVVLMMTLFATIFQMASRTTSLQKSLLENDQRSRLVSSTLRQDIARRTMKLVLPFAANEDVTLPEARLSERQGYFYIREGNPDDDTDDLLQMTVALRPGEEPFYGLWARRDPVTGALSDLPRANLGGSTGNGGRWPNHPDADDRVAGYNRTSTSSRAEVAYFLRGGSLYRRVLLIRQPAVAGLDSAQPTDINGAPLDLSMFEAGGTPPLLNFYSCADFSAWRNPISGRLQFHSIHSLNNEGAAGTFPLSNPALRFGHDPVTGLPRELDKNGLYFGRFTHGETSFTSSTAARRGFGYPGRIDPNNNWPNPYAASTNNAGDLRTNVTLDPTTAVIAEYPGGTRMSEDLLMTNVQRFDIKVWDEAASRGPDGFQGRAGDDGNGVPGNDDGELGWPGSDDGMFVDLGHSGTIGFYRGANPGPFGNASVNPYRGNASYSPNGDFRFDTWSPRLDLDGDGLFDRPPFRAGFVGLDGKPGWANINDDGNLIEDPSLFTTAVANTVNDNPNELGWPGTDDTAQALKCIQIQITYLEPSTKTLRDVTLIFALDKD